MCMGMMMETNQSARGKEVTSLRLHFVCDCVHRYAWIMNDENKGTANFAKIT